MDALAARQAAVADQDATPAVEVLVQRAVEALTLSPPVPRLSVEGSAYVGVPLWLWIDDDPQFTGPLEATATAGAATVTAVGRLSAVEWAMGPPGATVTCDGPGTAWSGQEGWSPDCGYTYTERSLPERTGGTGAWTVTTTSVWTVTWTGFSDGAPVTGVETVLVATEAALPVGEVQVLTTGGGR